MQIKKIKGKRGGGEWTAEEIGKLVLTIGGAILIVILAYKIISPYFDKNAEAAKGYLSSFQQQIAVADSGNEGEINLWQNDRISMVIFGNNSYVTEGEYSFFHSNSKNTVCFCIWNVKTCKYCVNLASPIIFNGQSKGIVYYKSIAHIKKENRTYNIYETEVDYQLGRAQQVIDQMNSGTYQTEQPRYFFFSASSYLNNKFYIKYDGAGWWISFFSLSELTDVRSRNHTWTPVSPDMVNGMIANLGEAGESEEANLVKTNKDLILSLGNKNFQEGYNLIKEKVTE